MARPVRLWSGLVLFTYVTPLRQPRARPHLARRHGGGARSGSSRSGATRSATHGSTRVPRHSPLALWSIYRRRTLRMPAWEATQLVLGLTIPPLLAATSWHAARLRSLFGTEDSYIAGRALALGAPTAGPASSDRAPDRLDPRLHRTPLLAALATLVSERSSPLVLPRVRARAGARLLGFADGGPRGRRGARGRAGSAQRLLAEQPLGPEEAATLERDRVALFRVHVGAACASSWPRAARGSPLHAGAMVRIGYPDGKSVTVPVGSTVLEASRSAGIPHASVCGGRGRCSTCRVRVVAGDRAPPPAAERRGAARARARGRAAQCPPRVPARPHARPRGDAASRRRPRRRGSRAARDRVARGASRRSRCSSPISAALRGWPSTSCPMTWSSSSTATSRRSGAPSPTPAASRTSTRRRRHGALRRGRRARATPAGRR